MHLVCLGVVKKMITLWVEGPLNVRMPARDVKIISDRLIKIRSFTLPSFTARKPRSLSGYRHYKATELHKFLIYISVIVLKKVLRPDLYEHFLILHVAISILINHELVKSDTSVNYAYRLLKKFIIQFQDLYC